MEEGKKEPLEMWAIGTWGGGHWVLSQLKAGALWSAGARFKPVTLCNQPEGIYGLYLKLSVLVYNAGLSFLTQSAGKGQMGPCTEDSV